MPRLGDLLVQAGRVSQTQVEDAARSQVAYGGRLGTNLVELGYLDLDEVATFLGRQHRLPAAERRHFEQADAELQALLPAALAARHGVVPIARLAADARRVAVAVIQPLAPGAALEVAIALGCTADQLVYAVAAELRILYNLEKVYAIPRPTRFLRTRRGATEDVAVVAVVDDDDLSDPDAPIPIRADTQPDWAQGHTTDEVALDVTIDVGDGADADDATGAERRRFVRTIADDTDPPSYPSDEPLPVAQRSLGRIHLRKAAFAAAIEGHVAHGETTADELRAIRRCRDRDRIGALAIQCLARPSPAELDAGVVFIARGPIAVGWTGFARRVEIAFDQLAVPLDQPSVLAREPGLVCRRLVGGDDAATELDRRLLDALAPGAPPAFAVAAPIAIRDQLIGYVYAQGTGDADTAEALVTGVADATRSALTNLLRAAQR
jgi:hypothetical protein